MGGLDPDSRPTPEPPTEMEGFGLGALHTYSAREVVPTLVSARPSAQERIYPFKMADPIDSAL